MLSTQLIVLRVVIHRFMCTCHLIYRHAAGLAPVRGVGDGDGDGDVMILRHLPDETAFRCDIARLMLLKGNATLREEMIGKNDVTNIISSSQFVVLLLRSMSMLLN